MIPILINVRDRFTCTQRLADWCAALPGAVVHLVDNASTYPPLLDWYDRCSHRVHRLPQNLGPQAPWSVLPSVIGEAMQFVITDCDLDLSHCPTDVLNVLRRQLDRRPELIKAGVALRIDDLPDTETGRLARQREADHWNNPQVVDDCVIFDAPIDTTFAMYPAGGPRGTYAPAVRVAGSYAARHVPWYYASEALPDDERYYLDHLNPVGLFYSPKMKALACA